MRGIETEDKMAETHQGEEAVNMNASDSSSSTVPDSQHSKEIQLSTLEKAFKANLEIDRTVYLLPVKWFLAFAAWVKGDAGEPGPLDPGASLCDEHGVIHENLVEGKDFHYITAEAWDMVKEAYEPS